MSLRYAWATFLCAAGAILAQPAAAPTAGSGGEFVIAPGTRIPLGLINTITTKNAHEGDHVYLETVFPILASGRIVIPPGSYVAGTMMEVKRPGRVKGRGELYPAIRLAHVAQRRDPRFPRPPWRHRWTRRRGIRPSPRARSSAKGTRPVTRGLSPAPPGRRNGRPHGRVGRQAHSLGAGIGAAAGATAG